MPLLFFLFCLPGPLFSQSCPERAYPLPDLSAASRTKMEAQLQEAWNAYAQDSSRADAIIWYGRRLAYLGRYTEAIRVFGRGAQLHTGDARFLRHRGHRYITVRCNPAAIDDLTRAAAIEKGRPDQVEPDGIPPPSSSTSARRRSCGRTAATGWPRARSTSTGVTPEGAGSRTTITGVGV